MCTFTTGVRWCQNQLMPSSWLLISFIHLQNYVNLNPLPTTQDTIKREFMLWWEEMEIRCGGEDEGREGVNLCKAVYFCCFENNFSSILLKTSAFDSSRKLLRVTDYEDNNFNVHKQIVFWCFSSSFCQFSWLFDKIYFCDVN